MGIELAKAFVTVRGDMSRVGRDISGGRKKVMASLRGIASEATAIMASIGAPIAIGAVFSKLISGGEEFNQKMRQSLAIMGDVSDAMKRDMASAAFEAARVTKFSAAQAAESFFFLASAGLDAEQSVRALPQVAQFAQAGMFDMAMATDLATDAQSALGLRVEDASENLANLTRVTDVFVKANTLANTSVQQVAEAMTNKGGAAARAAGKDIEEVTAVLAAFADQGLKGAAAGTGLDIILRELKRQARENAEAFRDANVKVFDDTTGKMRNMADIVGDLENKLAGMSVQQKEATLAGLGFNRQALSLTNTLVGTSEQIRAYEKELRAVEDTTKRISSKQLTPFQKATAELGVEATKTGKFLVDAFGEDLAKATTDAVSNIREVAVAMKEVRDIGLPGEGPGVRTDEIRELKKLREQKSSTFFGRFNEMIDVFGRQDLLLQKRAAETIGKKLEERRRGIFSGINLGSGKPTVDFSKEPTFEEGARDLFGLGKQVATGLAGAFEDAGKEMSARRINEVFGKTISSALGGINVGRLSQGLQSVVEGIGVGASAIEGEFERQKAAERVQARRQMVPSRVGVGGLGRSIQDRLLGNHQAKAANELEKQTPLLKRLVDLMQGEGSTTATLG